MTAILALLAAAALARGVVYGEPNERVATNSPKFLSKGGARAVREGDDVELKCDVHDLGEFVLLWKFNRSLVLFAGNLRIHRDDRISRDDQSGALKIKGFLLENQGDYTCQVSTNPPQDITYSLHLLGPPQIKATPSDLQATPALGEKAALECQAEGARVQWRRVGHEDKVLAEGARLEWEVVRKEDAAEYECVASNELGQSNRRFSLRVLYAPEMEMENVETLVHAPIDSEARLQCQFKSEPQANVTWLRGGATIFPSAAFHVERAPNSQVLVIPRVTRDSYGQYTCSLTNQLGSASLTFDLSGRPSRAKFTSAPLIGRQSRARLHFTLRSASPLTKLEVRVREAGAQKDAFRRVDALPETDASGVERAAAAEVEGLSLDTRYEAEVLAENEFGATLSESFAFVTSGAWLPVVSSGLVVVSITAILSLALIS